MTLSEAFDLYCQDYIVYNNQSRRTEEVHYMALRSLIKFAKDIQIESLTFDTVRRWKLELQKGGRSPLTVRQYIIKIRLVLRYLKREGYSVLDYEKVGIPQRVTKVPDFLTKEEVTTLLQVASTPSPGYRTVNRMRNRAIISLLFASGVRASELCGLNRSDMRVDNSFTVIGKGRKPRLCFFDIRTRLYLDDYLILRLDSDPALFLSDQTGKRMTVNTLQYIFRELGKRAGFQKPIHPHILRHSYATNLLRNNTNLRYVRDFLGHSSVQTTEMYTHVVDEDLRKIYDEKHTI